ncbi:MAG: flagellar hook-basal body complex protein FliE [Thermodesulfobacteriota bacterium]|nr:flagellar hook-basal body complex protein FliE [Thermodesulfobacteriota bacterium]
MKDITIQSGLKSAMGADSNQLRPQTGTSESFADTLKHSIENVNNLQNEADQAIQELMVGKTKDIHKTMIAMEKADISFRMMMQVRNKIVEAYDEIMRMQV